MEEMGKEEFVSTLQSFQKDKSTRLDGFPVELFLASFNFIGGGR
jgi:hypothetical protein